MDIISTQDLHDSFKAKFSIGTNSLARFTAAFLSAYNDSLMDLFNAQVIDEPKLLTAITYPATHTNTTNDEAIPSSIGLSYHNTDDGTYFTAVATDAGSQLFTDTDFWRQVFYDSALTINYLPIIKVGIINYLQQAGEWVKGDSRDEYAHLNWQRRIGEAANIKTTEAVSAGTYTGPWAE